MRDRDRLISKFLNFKLAKGSFKHSRVYKQCQLILLKDGMKTKSSIFLKQKKEFEIARNSI